MDNESRIAVLESVLKEFRDSVKSLDKKMSEISLQVHSINLAEAKRGNLEAVKRAECFEKINADFVKKTDLEHLLEKFLNKSKVESKAYLRHILYIITAIAGLIVSASGILGIINTIN